jgi:RNA polymerase sigma factor (TIGR02999 family)
VTLSIFSATLYWLALMSPSAQRSIASLMAAFRDGDSGAGAQLMELFYPELKRLAAGQLQRERQGHSLQPTLLVNEVYLQLIKIKNLPQTEAERANDKAAFFALAGQIMKRLLIHHARPLSHKAQKVPVLEDLRLEADNSLIEVEEILSRLASIKPVIRTVVELKVFEGRTAEEIAQQLGCATVTVHRHWQFARQWMKAQWVK